MKQRATLRDAMTRIETPAHEPTHRPARPALRAVSAEAVRAEGKRTQGWVQLTILVPADVRQRAKVAAIQAGSDLSTVVTDFLRGWVEKS